MGYPARQRLFRFFDGEHIRGYCHDCVHLLLYHLVALLEITEVSNELESMLNLSPRNSITGVDRFFTTISRMLPSISAMACSELR